MAGKMSRSKGALGERGLANYLTERGFPSKRNARNGIAGRDGGQDVAHSLGPYWIEVKRQEKLAIPAWVRQAEEDCPPGDVPLVVFRQSRQPWRVVIQLDDLLTIITNKEKQHEQVS